MSPGWSWRSSSKFREASIDLTFRTCASTTPLLILRNTTTCECFDSSVKPPAMATASATVVGDRMALSQSPRSLIPPDSAPVGYTGLVGQIGLDPIGSKSGRRNPSMYSGCLIATFAGAATAPRGRHVGCLGPADLDGSGASPEASSDCCEGQPSQYGSPGQSCAGRRRPAP